jgi:hypothetical protein
MDFKTIQVSNYHGILYAEPEIIVGYVKFLNQLIHSFPDVDNIFPI